MTNSEFIAKVKQAHVDPFEIEPKSYFGECVDRLEKADIREKLLVEALEEWLPGIIVELQASKDVKDFRDPIGHVGVALNFAKQLNKALSKYRSHHA